MPAVGAEIAKHARAPTSSSSVTNREWASSRRGCSAPVARRVQEGRHLPDRRRGATLRGTGDHALVPDAEAPAHDSVKASATTLAAVLLSPRIGIPSPTTVSICRDRRPAACCAAGRRARRPIAFRRTGRIPRRVSSSRSREMTRFLFCTRYRSSSNSRRVRRIGFAVDRDRRPRRSRRRGARRDSPRPGARPSTVPRRSTARTRAVSSRRLNGLVT